MFFLDKETQFEDLKQVIKEKGGGTVWVNDENIIIHDKNTNVKVERLMKSHYLGSGPYTPASQPGLVNMLTDAKVASPLHQVIASLTV